MTPTPFTRLEGGVAALGLVVGISAAAYGGWQHDWVLVAVGFIGVLSGGIHLWERTRQWQDEAKRRGGL